MTLQPAVFATLAGTVYQDSFRVSRLRGEFKGKKKGFISIHNGKGINRVPEPTMGEVGAELVMTSNNQISRRRQYVKLTEGVGARVRESQVGAVGLTSGWTGSVEHVASLHPVLFGQHIALALQVGAFCSYTS